MSHMYSNEPDKSVDCVDLKCPRDLGISRQSLLAAGTAASQEELWYIDCC